MATRIISPGSPSVRSVRRKLELFARWKTSSENTNFELSSGFCSVTRLFAFLDTAESSHYRILVLHLHRHTLSPKWTLFLINYIYRHRHDFPNPAVIQFALTSIPASFGTQIWSILLTSSYRKLVFSLLLPLPNLPLINTQLKSFEFFWWIRYWYPLKPKDDFPIPLETSAVSPIMINPLTRATTNFQSLSKPNDKWRRQNGRLASIRFTAVDVKYKKVWTTDGHFVHCRYTGLQVFTVFFRTLLICKKMSASTTMCHSVAAWPTVSVAHLSYLFTWRYNMIANWIFCGGTPDGEGIDMNYMKVCEVSSGNSADQ